MSPGPKGSPITSCTDKQSLKRLASVDEFIQFFVKSCAWAQEACLQAARPASQVGQRVVQLVPLLRVALQSVLFALPLLELLQGLG